MKSGEWFSLYHYGEKIADFCLDGNSVWKPASYKYEKLFVSTDSIPVPNFVRNLFPEGWLASQILDRNETDIENISQQRNNYISGGYRFLSNFTITKISEPSPDISLDYKLDDLSNHIDEKGRFKGKIIELAGSSGDPEFEQKLAQYWKNRQTARYSGAELKTPQCLCANGELKPAIDSAPFNVFLKYAGRDGFNSLGINEFMGLSMAKAVGLEPPTFCIIEQSNELPPIFGIERYDIPYGHDKDFSVRFITQDFVTLLGLQPNEKASGSLEKVGKCLKELSNSINPAKTVENLEKLFIRSVLSWVANDTDMHLKNISVLMEYDPITAEYTNAHFSPSYDITTDVKARQMENGQRLSVSGSKNKLKPQHFVNFAINMGLYDKDKERILFVIKDIAKKAAKKALDIYYNPPVKNLSEDIRYDMSVIVSHVVDRARAFGVEGLEWDSSKVWGEFAQKSVKARVKEGAGYRRDLAMNVPLM